MKEKDKKLQNYAKHNQHETQIKIQGGNNL